MWDLSPVQGFSRWAVFCRQHLFALISPHSVHTGHWGICPASASRYCLLSYSESWPSSIVYFILPLNPLDCPASLNSIYSCECVPSVWITKASIYYEEGLNSLSSLTVSRFLKISGIGVFCLFCGVLCMNVCELCFN